MKLLLINPRNRVSLYGDYLWEPLSLGYVAAATPSHWDVELIDEQCEGALDYSQVPADLVGLTAFTTQAPRAYQIAAQFRDRGIPVVMGGIHASLVSDEAAQYADSLFVGECETLWPSVIADVEGGRLQRKPTAGPTAEACSCRTAGISRDQLRIRLRANHARVSDGLLVLLGHRVQQPAVPHARDRARSWPKSLPSRSATSSSSTTT